jgi:hypothetical protein
MSDSIIVDALHTPSAVPEEIDRSLPKLEDLVARIADRRAALDADEQQLAMLKQEQVRHRIAAIVALGGDVEPRAFKAMMTAGPVADAEQAAAVEGALLSRLLGIASDVPTLVAQANPMFANMWRAHQLDLSSFIRRRCRPISGDAAILPQDVRRLLDIAGGQA